VPFSPRKPTYRELVGLIEAQQRRIAELERLVEELRRRGKRQSAPFSRGTPRPNPKKPCRKAGKAYGRQAMRPVPSKADQHVLV
jgi:transposase